MNTFLLGTILFAFIASSNCVTNCNGLEGFYCDCSRPTDYLDCRDPLNVGFRPCAPGTVCINSGNPSANPCGWGPSTCPVVPSTTTTTTTGTVSNGRKAMTMIKTLHYSETGVDKIDCLNLEGCAPLDGDTLCTTSLPVLCLYADGADRPDYPLIANYCPTCAVPNKAYYQGWSEGHLQSTLPTAGTSLVSRAAADQICVNSFGTGWRMAEFHDGIYDYTAEAGNQPFGAAWGASTTKTNGGWAFHGFGFVRNDTRLWVAVDGGVNCWM